MLSAACSISGCGCVVEHFVYANFNIGWATERRRLTFKKRRFANDVVSCTLAEFAVDAWEGLGLALVGSELLAARNRVQEVLLAISVVMDRCVGYRISRLSPPFDASISAVELIALTNQPCPRWVELWTGHRHVSVDPQAGEEGELKVASVVLAIHRDI